MYVIISSVRYRPLKSQQELKVAELSLEVNGFFNKWDGAIKQVVDQIMSTIPGIIAAVDPVKKTNVKLNAMLSIVSIGLSFIPVFGPEVAGLSALALKGLNLAISGIKNAPGSAQQVWPVGTEDSKDYQIEELTTQFSRAVLPALEKKLEAGLGIVQGVNQSNVSSFLGFTEGGAFSTNAFNSPTVNFVRDAKIQPLSVAFTTFLVSTALAQNRWHALMLPGVDPGGITHRTAGCPPNWAGDCIWETDLQCSRYDDYGQCDGTYWYVVMDIERLHVAPRSSPALSLVMSVN